MLIKFAGRFSFLPALEVARELTKLHDPRCYWQVWLAIPCIPAPRNGHRVAEFVANPGIRLRPVVHQPHVL